MLDTQSLGPITHWLNQELQSRWAVLCTAKLNIHWKDWCRSSSTLATWCKEPTHWERPWCWERLKAGEEGGDRGWDDLMASLTQQTRIWTSFGRWWRTGKPGVLQSMGLQRAMTQWWNNNNKRLLGDSDKCWNLKTTKCPCGIWNISTYSKILGEMLYVAFPFKMTRCTVTAY